MEGSTTQKRSRTAGVKRRKKDRKSGVSHDRLELIITTVNRSKAEYYTDLMQSFGINVQLVAPGHGTADARMLAMFGLTDTEKAVIFGIVRADAIDDVMYALDEKFRTIKNGKGIAYTVPLTGVIGTLIFGFLSNNKKAVKENEK